MKKVKVKVTNKKYDTNIAVGSVIEIPENLLKDFIGYKHGELVVEKAEVKAEKDKAEKAPKNKAE
jgi:hypothetical protein